LFPVSQGGEVERKTGRGEGKLSPPKEGSKIASIARSIKKHWRVAGKGEKERREESLSTEKGEGRLESIKPLPLQQYNQKKIREGKKRGELLHQLLQGGGTEKGGGEDHLSTMGERRNPHSLAKG